MQSIPSHSFHGLQEDLVQRHRSKYLNAQRQYLRHVDAYVTSTANSMEFPPFSSFTDKDGWCGHGKRLTLIDQLVNHAFTFVDPVVGHELLRNLFVQ